MKIFKGFQRGVNLGGWISQFDQYDTKHFETFITEQDIADISALGFDHVRVPVDYNVLQTQDGSMIKSGFQYLKNCHAWCEKHHLNMLIDLHECYGYSFDPLKKDMDRARFFTDEALISRFLDLWKEIAFCFAENPNTVAFQPLNEVVLAEVKDDWNKIVARYIETIRAICPYHYIVIGGVCYNNVMSVPLLEKPADDHVVYNFHCYEPMVFTHQGAYWVDFMPEGFRIGYPKSLEEYRAASLELTNDLAGAVFAPNAGEMGPAFFEGIFMPAIVHAKKYDVALYCGEYGVIDLAAGEDKLRWLKDIHAAFAKFGIGHALWNYKEKDFGFTGAQFGPIRERFMECL